MVNLQQTWKKYVLFRSSELINSMKMKKQKTVTAHSYLVVYQFHLTGTLLSIPQKFFNSWMVGDSCFIMIMPLLIQNRLPSKFVEQIHVKVIEYPSCSPGHMYLNNTRNQQRKNNNKQDKIIYVLFISTELDKDIKLK